MGWIENIDSTSEYRNRIPAMGECELVRNTIDSVGSATHYPTLGTYEIFYERFKNFLAIVCTPSRPNNSNHFSLLPNFSSDVEEIGGLFYISEFLGIEWIFYRDE